MRTDLSNRWEHGSEFHLMTYGASETASNPWGKGYRSYASGRDAFRSLLCLGQKVRGWKRLWVPSYYCQDVIQCIRSTGIEIRVYVDGPDCEIASIDESLLAPGDVILLVNFFGLKAKCDYRNIDRKLIDIIEDHTHDPWSILAHTSDADWCVASLRKSLPVPDGAVVWSPLDRSLPVFAPATPLRQEASSKKLAAMLLKHMYLCGHSVSKDDYRNLFKGGEDDIFTEEISGMTIWSANLVDTFPIYAWREIRKSNHKYLSEALSDVPSVTILQPADAKTSCPFSCITVFDTSEQRNHVRDALIRAKVYPALLWPLDAPLVDGIPSQHIHLSRRILSIHCDMRYTEHDMGYIAELIRIHSLRPDCKKLPQGLDNEDFLNS